MKTEDIKLRVNEIFYSIQGEGYRVGQPTIFIRLSGCNLKCDFCDTDHSSSTEMTLEEIFRFISQNYSCSYIVWTGGEPLLQLTHEILVYFTGRTYKQGLETNGTRKLLTGFDHITISPKVIDPLYNWRNDYLIGNPQSMEIRYPIKFGDKIPTTIIQPYIHYYLSPIFSKDEEETKRNIEYCIKLVKDNPKWRLSVQIQKLCNFQ